MSYSLNQTNGQGSKKPKIKSSFREMKRESEVQKHWLEHFFSVWGLKVVKIFEKKKFFKVRILGAFYALKWEFRSQNELGNRATEYC